jgi:hypothetical protein
MICVEPSKIPRAYHCGANLIRHAQFLSTLQSCWAVVAQPEPMSPWFSH